MLVNSCIRDLESAGMSQSRKDCLVQRGCRIGGDMQLANSGEQLA